MVTRVPFALCALQLCALQPFSGNTESRSYAPSLQESSPEPTPTTIAGTLCGMDGRPLDNITIELQGRDQGGSIFNRRPKIDEPLRTNGEGRFEISRTLDPMHRYVFRWKGDGVVTGCSGWLGVSELTTDLELVAVARRPFHGRLLHVDGSPVAEAEVRIRRQGESATTNQDGEFRLGHLAEAPEPVLIREVDGHIRWTLMKANDAWEDVVLQDSSSLTATQQSRPRKTPNDQRMRALTMRLRFEWLDAAVEAGNYIDTRWRLLECAELDLDATLKRLWDEDLTPMFAQASIYSFNDRSTCGLGTHYDSNVKEGTDLRKYTEAQIRLAADTDSAEARAAYETFIDGPPQDIMLKLRLGYGFGVESNQTPKLTSVERARRDVTRAASMAKYYQVRTYCRSALVLLRAGHEVEARSVIERARAIVAPGETPSFLSDDYIQALSAFDLDAALELIRAKTDVRKRFSALMTLAMRLSSDSPGEAAAIVEEAEAVPVSRYSSRRSRMRLHKTIYNLSATDFKAAERLTRQYDWTGYGLGLLALSVARGVAAVPLGDRPREVERLLTAGYAKAQEESSRKYRNRALASLMAVAMEVSGEKRGRWVGETLWSTSECSAGEDHESVLAWSLRMTDPEFASVLAFASVHGVMCRTFDWSESWHVATWFDPERSVALALQEGGDGLDRTARALERDPAKDALSPPTCAGFYWPKD